MSKEEERSECERCGNDNVKIYSDGLCLKCWGDEQTHKKMKEYGEDTTVGGN